MQLKKMCVVVLVAFGLAGCIEAESPSEDVSSKSYDMRDFFPNTNITNTLGDYRKDNLTDDNFTYYGVTTEAYFMTQTGFELDNGGQYKIAFQFTNENVTETSGSDVTTMPRMFNLGDTLISESGTGWSRSCTAEKYDITKDVVVDSQTYTFSDVITVKCRYVSDEIDISQLFYAKGKGFVGRYDSDCYTKTDVLNDDLQACVSGAVYIQVLISQ